MKTPVEIGSIPKTQIFEQKELSLSLYSISLFLIFFPYFFLSFFVKISSHFSDMFLLYGSQFTFSVRNNFFPYFFCYWHKLHLEGAFFGFARASNGNIKQKRIPFLVGPSMCHRWMKWSVSYVHSGCKAISLMSNM